jgi:hypothetical protein
MRGKDTSYAGNRLDASNSGTPAPRHLAASPNIAPPWRASCETHRRPDYRRQGRPSARASIEQRANGGPNSKLSPTVATPARAPVRVRARVRTGQAAAPTATVSGRASPQPRHMQNSWTSSFAKSPATDARSIKACAIARARSAFGDLDPPRLTVTQMIRLFNAFGRGRLLVRKPADSSATMPSQEPYRSAEAVRRVLPNLFQSLQWLAKIEGPFPSSLLDSSGSVLWFAHSQC